MNDDISERDWIQVGDDDGHTRWDLTDADGTGGEVPSEAVTGAPDATTGIAPGCW